MIGDWVDLDGIKVWFHALKIYDPSVKIDAGNLDTELDNRLNAPTPVDETVSTPPYIVNLIASTADAPMHNGGKWGVTRTFCFFLILSTFLDIICLTGAILVNINDYLAKIRPLLTSKEQKTSFFTQSKSILLIANIFHF